jgi:hypothetical protein
MASASTVLEGSTQLGYTAKPLNWDKVFPPLYRGCPLFGGSKCIRTKGKLIIWDIELFLIKRCPYFRGSTIGGSIVIIIMIK